MLYSLLQHQNKVCNFGFIPKSKLSIGLPMSYSAQNDEFVKPTHQASFTLPKRISPVVHFGAKGNASIWPKTFREAHKYPTLPIESLPCSPDWRHSGMSKLDWFLYQFYIALQQRPSSNAIFIRIPLGDELLKHCKISANHIASILGEFGKSNPNTCKLFKKDGFAVPSLCLIHVNNFFEALERLQLPIIAEANAERLKRGGRKH